MPVTSTTRAVLIAALTTMAALASTALDPQVATAQDEPPPAERRVTSNRDSLEGRGETGISVENISALTARAAAANGGSSGGSSPCRWAVAWRPDGSLDESTSALSLRTLSGDLPSDATFVAGFRIEIDGTGHQLIQNGADGDRLRYVLPYGSDACATASGAFITVAEVEDLARQAFAEMQQRWPAQEILLGWPQPTEDTWTALSTGLTWEPISATAASGGLQVTVTATPTSAVWDTGQVNTRIGGERTVRCDGPGDLPRLQEQARCRVWLAGPSTGLSDRNGQPDAITLGLTVQWQVGYTSNFGGFANSNWLQWPTESFLDGVVVNTTQAVAASRT